MTKGKTAYQLLRNARKIISENIRLHSEISRHYGSLGTWDLSSSEVKPYRGEKLSTISDVRYLSSHWQESFRNVYVSAVISVCRVYSEMLCPEVNQRGRGQCKSTLYSFLLCSMLCMCPPGHANTHWHLSVGCQLTLATLTLYKEGNWVALGFPSQSPFRMLVIQYKGEKVAYHL